MAETEQPTLFTPDGKPNPEVVKILKKIEEDSKNEFQKKFLEEIQEKIEERHKDHAP